MEDKPTLTHALNVSSDATHSIHQMELEQQPELTAAAVFQTNKNKNKKLLMIIACVVLVIIMSIIIGVMVNNNNESSNQNADLSPIDAELSPIDHYQDKPSLLPHHRLLVPTDNPSNNPSDTPQSGSPSNNPSDRPLTGFPSEHPSDSPHSGSPSNYPQTGNPSDIPSNSPKTINPSDSPQTENPSDHPSNSPKTEHPSDSPEQRLSDSPSYSPQQDLNSGLYTIKTDYPGGPWCLAEGTHLTNGHSLRSKQHNLFWANSPAECIKSFGMTGLPNIYYLSPSDNDYYDIRYGGLNEGNSIGKHERNAFADHTVIYSAKLTKDSAGNQILCISPADHGDTGNDCCLKFGGEVYVNGFKIYGTSTIVTGREAKWDCDGNSDPMYFVNEH